MTAQEAKQRLERIWKAYTSAYDSISEDDVTAFNMVINALGAIEQIQWERDMAIKQLHDLGYGLGEKPREEVKKSNQEVKKSSQEVKKASDADRILKILESAKDKNSDVPMSIVRKAFDKLLPPAQPDVHDTNVGKTDFKPETVTNCHDLMDDTISRQAAIDIERNATVDTNPSHFEAHQKFTQFMDDAEISSFGRWQWSNGFNTALTAVGVDLKRLPSAQPESCEGCIQYGLWENEVEYGYSSPCTRCKRRANDNYER